MQFNTLIAPLNIQEFIAQYWNKSHFHLNRKEESFYQKLISKEAIDQVLFNNQNLAFGAFKFYRGKEEASPQHYSQSKLQNNRSVTVLDPKKVTQLFAQGYSCYINQPDQFFSNLNLFLGELEANLGIRTACHLIISPAKTQGFLPHTDPYSVLVLQLAGKKTWQIYDQVQDGPQAGGQDHHYFIDKKPQASLVLEAGDLLYLPKGLVHSVNTTDQHSIHLSIGLQPATGADLIKLISQVARQSAFFQKDLPFGPPLNEETLASFKDHFKDQLNILLEEIDLAELIQQEIQTKQQERVTQSPITAMASIDHLSIDSVLRWRPNVQLKSITGPNAYCILECAGNHLNFPATWTANLQYLLSKQEIMLKEIGLDLGIQEEDRMNIASKLLLFNFAQLMQTA